MKVLIGAAAVWLILSALLGFTIFLMTVKGVFWPFVVVLIGSILLVKKVGCSAH